MFRTPLLVLGVAGLVLASCASARISIIAQDGTDASVRFEIAGPLKNSAVECSFRDASGSSTAVVIVRMPNLTADEKHADTCAPAPGFAADPTAVTVRIVAESRIPGAIQSLAPGTNVDYSPPTPWPSR